MLMNDLPLQRLDDLRRATVRAIQLLFASGIHLWRSLPNLDANNQLNCAIEQRQDEVHHRRSILKKKKKQTTNKQTNKQTKKRKVKKIEI